VRRNNSCGSWMYWPFGDIFLSGLFQISKLHLCNSFIRLGPIVCDMADASKLVKGSFCIHNLGLDKNLYKKWVSCNSLLNGPSYYLKTQSHFIWDTLFNFGTYPPHWAHNCSIWYLIFKFFVNGLKIVHCHWNIIMSSTFRYSITRSNFFDIPNLVYM
jgi:hypothetical protein